MDPWIHIFYDEPHFKSAVKSTVESAVEFIKKVNSTAGSAEELKKNSSAESAEEFTKK